MRVTDEGVPVRELIEAVKQAIKTANVSSTDLDRDLRVGSVQLALNVVAVRSLGGGLDFCVPFLGMSVKLGGKVTHHDTHRIEIGLVPPDPAGRRCATASSQCSPTPSAPCAPSSRAPRPATTRSPSRRGRVRGQAARTGRRVCPRTMTTNQPPGSRVVGCIDRLFHRAAAVAERRCGSGQKCKGFNRRGTASRGRMGRRRPLTSVGDIAVRLSPSDLAHVLPRQPPVVHRFPFRVGQGRFLTGTASLFHHARRSTTDAL